MRKSVVSFVAVSLLVAVVAISCSSEAPGTKALYTDARDMFNDINGAFQMPKGQARVDTMRRIINEKWDEQIPAKLQEYLQKAPNGMYADSARKLEEDVKNSSYIQMITQVRPLMQQAGMPQTPAEADSMVKKMQPEPKDSE